MRKLLGLALLALVPAMAVARPITRRSRAGSSGTHPRVPLQHVVAIKPTKDEEVCAKDKDFRTEDWVISPKGGIKNVVVWLAPEPKAGGPKLKDLPSFDKKDIHPMMLKPAKPTVEIDQPCCRFIPHVLAAQEGQGMIIKMRLRAAQRQVDFA